MAVIEVTHRGNGSHPRQSLLPNFQHSFLGACFKSQRSVIGITASENQRVYPRPENSSRPSVADRETMRVLIIHNNDDASNALRGLLQSAGHIATATWSGMEALELLKSQEFDALLLNHYLADLYVGDFLDRVSRLPIRPRFIAMQGSVRADAASSSVPSKWSILEDHSNGHGTDVRDQLMRVLQSE